MQPKVRTTEVDCGQDRWNQERSWVRALIVRELVGGHTSEGRQGEEVVFSTISTQLEGFLVKLKLRSPPLIPVAVP